jgi:hypothetical protein
MFALIYVYVVLVVIKMNFTLIFVKRNINIAKLQKSIKI